MSLILFKGSKLKKIYKSQTSVLEKKIRRRHTIDVVEKGQADLMAAKEILKKDLERVAYSFKSRGFDDERASSEKIDEEVDWFESKFNKKKIKEAIEWSKCEAATTFQNREKISKGKKKLASYHHVSAEELKDRARKSMVAIEVIPKFIELDILDYEISTVIKYIHSWINLYDQKLFSFDWTYRVDLGQFSLHDELFRLHCFQDWYEEEKDDWGASFFKLPREINAKLKIEKNKGFKRIDKILEEHEQVPDHYLGHYLWEEH